MKLNAALLFALFLPIGCHKGDAPTPAGSGASLAGGAVPGAAAPAAGSLSILDGFEGEVDLTAKGKFGAKAGAAAPVNLALLVRDGKFRVDLPEGLAEAKEIGKAFVLVMPAEKKLYAVLDAKKQAILVDFDKFANQAKALSAAHPRPNSGVAADVQKTGKTDTVAGYKCEIWHIVQAKSVADLCIAEQGTSWFHIPLSGVPAEFAWASEITDGKHFPLRLVMSENGTEQGRIEVASITKKPLPASEFQVPAGYNVTDLEQMLGAMLGGMPGALPGGAGMPPGMPPGMPAGLPLGAVHHGPPGAKPKKP